MCADSGKVIKKGHESACYYCADNSFFHAQCMQEVLNKEQKRIRACHPCIRANISQVSAHLIGDGDDTQPE